MKPFDDMLPEETSKEYEPLLALLSHAPRQSSTLTPEEQAQVIARVQSRLELVTKGVSQDEDIVAQYSSPAQESAQRTGKRVLSPHRGRILRFINTLAAVLVIGAIIGTSLLLFRHQSQTTGGLPVGLVGAPGTIYASAGGLEATLHITSGPYFLSELLAVDMTLTNHSHTTFQLEGFPASTPCEPALWLNYTLTGANTVHYTFPVYSDMSCPLKTTQLKLGQTIAIHQYIPLTDSGHVLLTEEAGFLVTKNIPNQGMTTTNGPSPLDGYWPSLHINVASRVPSDRILTQHRTGTKVFINAPDAARSRLLYLYSVGCMDFHDAGSTASGNYSWTPTTTTIGVPGCPGKNIQWTYAVSAPGYAIASGSYSS